MPLPNNVGRLALQVISAGFLLPSDNNLKLSFFAGGYLNTCWEV